MCAHNPSPRLCSMNKLLGGGIQKLGQRLLQPEALSIIVVHPSFYPNTCALPRFSNRQPAPPPLTPFPTQYQPVTPDTTATTKSSAHLGIARLCPNISVRLPIYSRCPAPVPVPIGFPPPVPPFPSPPPRSPPPSSPPWALLPGPPGTAAVTPPPPPRNPDPSRGPQK